MSTIVSASVLSADMCRLGEELDRIKASGCDHVHFDVMDGVFVDNISYGLPVLKSVRQYTNMWIDVHLMITDPLKYVKAFAQSGADIITFHLESASDPAETAAAIKEEGKKAGIAVKPETPVGKLLPYLDKADMALVMTVEPGFGGQGFISGTLDKVRELRRYVDNNSLNVHIQVDGGINVQTAAAAREAGADILVAGSYLFGAEDMTAACEALR
ncbi:MAG: ribulose-phosphate 3-epimerase [Ruminococcus sp.]|nr:ribulose-phosphate 3-epimerase [Ruminococcus sp.]